MKLNFDPPHLSFELLVLCVLLIISSISLADFDPSRSKCPLHLRSKSEVIPAGLEFEEYKTVGGYRAGIKKARLSWQDHTIELNETETRIVKTLIHKEGNLLPLTELLNLIGDVDQNSLDSIQKNAKTAISRLNGKLKQLFTAANNPMRSIYGLGYAWQPKGWRPKDENVTFVRDHFQISLSGVVVIIGDQVISDFTYLEILALQVLAKSNGPISESQIRDQIAVLKGETFPEKRALVNRRIDKAQIGVSRVGEVNSTYHLLYGIKTKLTKMARQTKIHFKGLIPDISFVNPHQGGDGTREREEIIWEMRFVD